LVRFPFGFAKTWIWFGMSLARFRYL